VTDHRATALALLEMADKWVEPDSRELLRESAFWGALVHAVLDVGAGMRCEDGDVVDLLVKQLREPPK
jgi:hypothetical protein